MNELFTFRPFYCILSYFHWWRCLLLLELLQTFLFYCWKCFVSVRFTLWINTKAAIIKYVSVCGQNKVSHWKLSKFVPVVVGHRRKYIRHATHKPIIVQKISKYMEIEGGIWDENEIKHTKIFVHFYMSKICSRNHAHTHIYIYYVLEILMNCSVYMLDLKCVREYGRWRRENFYISLPPICL